MNRNGRGPSEQGPRTGRGLGPCGRGSRKGVRVRRLGLGMGLGLGLGLGRRNRGQRFDERIG